MKAFIKQYSCKASEVFNSPGNAPVLSQANTLEACIKAGTPFYFMNYGNNAVAIAEFQKGFNKIFNIVIAVIAVLSGLILMGIIGRIIADGRRETAVFRAIGATRLDMSTVYGLYAFMIATLVVVASFILGLSAAALFSAHFSPAATPNALLAFNVADLSKKFVFIGFDLPNMLKIAGVIYLAALLGTLPPLAGNLHRNPLKDMRDEN